jgi:uncharacterized protein YbaR (Trm112 family)
MNGEHTKPVESLSEDHDLIECLSCPFCAASDLTVLAVSTEEVDNGFQVECDQCHAGGPIRLTKLEAQTAWNRSVVRD